LIPPASPRALATFYLFSPFSGQADPQPLFLTPRIVFLTNTSPAKCHIHTINRLPNCEDYGKALIAQWERENAKENVNGNGE
jgi:hypothetical protein